MDSDMHKTTGHLKEPANITRTDRSGRQADSHPPLAPERLTEHRHFQICTPTDHQMSTHITSAGGFRHLADSQVPVMPEIFTREEQLLTAGKNQTATNITRDYGSGHQADSASKPVDNFRKQDISDHLPSPDSWLELMLKGSSNVPEFLWKSMETIIEQGRENEEHYINQVEYTWKKLKREKDKRKVQKDLNTILKRRLETLKDVYGYLSGATSDSNSSLEELKIKEIELQRRQEKLEEKNAHDVVPRYLQSNAKLFTSDDLERAVEVKTKEIIEDKNAVLTRSEHVLTVELDDINTELVKAQEKIQKLKKKLKKCKPKEQQKLLKRLEIKEREVIKLEGLRDVLVKTNDLRRSAAELVESCNVDQQGHSYLSNILRTTIEKEVQLETECNTFKAELENIKSEYESVQRMEPNRFKEDEYGQMGPGHNTFDNTLKQWAETVESNLRRRLDKFEREVNIRKTHSQSVEFILYKVKDAVAKMKEGPNSEVAVSEFSLDLQRLLDQHETQSSAIQKQLNDLDEKYFTAKYWAEVIPFRLWAYYFL